MAQLAVRELDGPLVSADQAKALWEEYQELEAAILTDDDYMWFCEFQQWEAAANGRPGRMRLRKFTYNTRALAEAEVAKHPEAVLKKRKVKSATRKMGKYFALEMPVEQEMGHAEVEIRQEAGFIIHIERSKYYIITQWLDDKLKTVKASCTVVVRSPSGRTWIGHGGSHRDEGREDFTIAETAFTRGLNRAILDFVGFGEESAEDTPASEPVPGEQAPPTINSIIRPPLPDVEHRQAAWASIRGAITDKIVTPPQVVKWLREHHDIVMGEPILAKEEPPAAGTLSTNILVQLRDGLTQLQSQMEEPAG